MAGWTLLNSEFRRAILNSEDVKSDIICIQETHLADNITNQPELEGYKWRGHCRTQRHINANRTHGGVGIFIKESLYNVYDISILDSSYDGILSMLFKDKVTSYSFAVYCCYLPPETSPYGRDNTAFFTHLLSLIYLHNYVDCCFLAGDLNARISSKPDTIDIVDLIPDRETIDESFNKHGEAFLEFLLESRMIVTVGRVPGNLDFSSVSGRGKALVDWFAVPQENLDKCVSCDVIPLNEIIVKGDFQSLISNNCKPSDHSPIKLTYMIGSTSGIGSNHEDVSSQNAQENVKKKYQYNTMSEDFLKSDRWKAILDDMLLKINNVDPIQSQVDSLYNDMISNVFTEMDQYIQYKHVGNKTRKRLKIQKPFWNDDLTTSWKSMSDAERLFRKNRDSSLRNNLRSDFLGKQKDFDKLLRQTERIYNRQKAMEIETINTSNPTEFWRQINSLGPRKSAKIPMEVYSPSDHSKKVCDSQSVLDTWRHDFEGLYNIPDDEHSNFDIEFYERIMSCIPNIKQFELNNTQANIENYNQPFTIEEINKICNQLKIGKAVGPDMIPNEVLKNIGLRELMLSFLNYCFLNNVIPSTWRSATIAPIPKSASKDPCVPLNYRGISLLSCIYKMYSSVLNLRLTLHCEENSYIVDEQNGFRSQRSCQDHIYVLSTIIRNRKVTGHGTFCAFIDFKKAFDWVNRDLLLYKLSTLYNVHGRLFNTLSTIYSMSNSCLRLNGQLTESFNVSSGVRQGDVMSPTLFSMFLNDLATGIKELNCGIQINELVISILLYADDIVLIAPTEESLQKMLNFVSDWCRKWRMAVNTDKTKMIHFRKKSTPQTTYDFQLGSDSVEKVSCYKYLGVIFDEYISFEQNAKLLAESAGRALGALRYKLKFLKECGFKSFSKLFECGILSICDYSAGVWGTKKFEKIEQVMYRGARYYLGVHRFAPIDALLGDIGWVSSKTRHKILVMKLWNRLCELPSSRVTRKVLSWDLLYSNRQGSWSYNVKRILSDIGCQQLFDNITPCDIEYVKTILSEQDGLDWDVSRYKSDKLRYYNLYKCNKDIEDYVKLPSLKYHRSLLAQFRCGILPLQIEVGRFRNLQLDERICPICNIAVEDEIHFLCQCPLYNHLRCSLFKSASNEDHNFHSMDLFEKFVYLMSNQQKSVMKYLSKAVPLRTECLYNSSG